MSRIGVHYLLRLAAGESAEEKAGRIAFEQTLEMAPGSVDPKFEAQVRGRVEAIESLEAEAECARVTISYGEELAVDLSQLLNLLFGNVSLFSGVRVEGVDWTPMHLKRLPGPRYGLAGLRELGGLKRLRPLLCAVSKPVGRSAAELAHLCGELARGGVDIVKDDHSLGDQRTAPFRDRVRRCAEAVRRSGERTLYFPSLTGTPSQLAFRAEEAAGQGCRGVIVCPFTVGFGSVRELAQSTDLAIVAHPAMGGMYFHRDTGIAPELMLGEILPMLGCDAVIFPHAPGKYSLDAATCQEICRRVRASRGGSLPAAPAPGGSLTLETLPGWVETYGPDSMFIVGSGLQTGDSVRARARTMMDLLRTTAAGATA